MEIRPESRVGPSDVEQNLFPAAVYGADLCDLHVAIAPRPLMVMIEDYNPKVRSRGRAHPYSISAAPSSGEVRCRAGNGSSCLDAEAAYRRHRLAQSLAVRPTRSEVRTRFRDGVAGKAVLHAQRVATLLAAG